MQNYGPKDLGDETQVYGFDHKSPGIPCLTDTPETPPEPKQSTKQLMLFGEEHDALHNSGTI